MIQAQIQDINRNRFIKAYCIYWLSVSTLVLIASMYSHPVGEHVARSWMIVLVMLLAYSKSPFDKGMKVFLVKQHLCLITLIAQIWVAYGLMGYHGLDSVHVGWVIAALMYLGVVAFFASFLAKRIDPTFNSTKTS